MMTVIQATLWIATVWTSSMLLFAEQDKEDEASSLHIMAKLEKRHFPGPHRKASR